MIKTKTPIKRSNALIQFSREHHFGLLLVWKIRQGLKTEVDSERISNYLLFFFENELNAHFKEEEKDLFIKLPEEDALRIQAFQEHEKIYQLVADIRSDKTNTNILSEFAITLENHIRFEERSLFNHLQQILTVDEMKKLEEEHSKREGLIDDNWKDQFWIIK